MKITILYGTQHAYAEALGEVEFGDTVTVYFRASATGLTGLETLRRFLDFKAYIDIDEETRTMILEVLRTRIWPESENRGECRAVSFRVLTGEDDTSFFQAMASDLWSSVEKTTIEKAIDVAA